MAFSLVGAFTIGLQPVKDSVKIMKKIMITGKLGLIIDFKGMSCLALLLTQIERFKSGMIWVSFISAAFAT